MKNDQLGQVLGISKQREWWNRQTYRRSTEEKAAAIIDQTKHRNRSHSSGVHSNSRNPVTIDKSERADKVRSAVIQVARRGIRVRCKGFVTYLRSQAVVLNESNLRPDSAGASRLGKFASIQLAKVTVHTQDPARAAGKKHSFTFFVPEALVKRQNVKQGMRVTAVLHGIVANPSNPIWVCNRLRPSP